MKFTQFLRSLANRPIAKIDPRSRCRRTAYLEALEGRVLFSTTIVWEDHGNHLWNDAANWKVNGAPASTAPNNGGGVTYDVVINSGATIILNVAPTVDSIKVDGVSVSLNLSGNNLTTSGLNIDGTAANPGALTVSNSAAGDNTFDGGQINVATNANENAALDITGAHTLLTGKRLNVGTGNGATGSLTVESNARVGATGGTVGANDNLVNSSNFGSDQGKAVIVLKTGGSLTTTGVGVIGASANLRTQVTVEDQGTLWKDTVGLAIGNQVGFVDFTVEPDASMNTRDVEIWGGDGAGVVTVTTEGANWHNSSLFRVDGTLGNDPGGDSSRTTVEMDGSTFYSNQIDMADGAGQGCSFTFSDTFVQAGIVAVGGAPQLAALSRYAEMTIENGSIMTVDSGFYVGCAGDESKLYITGHNSEINMSLGTNMVVGEGGRVEFLDEGFGVISHLQLWGRALMWIKGAGSDQASSPEITVGTIDILGDAVLGIDDGGQVHAGSVFLDGTAGVNVGGAPFQAQIDVQGPHSTFYIGALTVGQSTLANAAGDVRIGISNGAYFYTGSTLFDPEYTGQATILIHDATWEDGTAYPILFSANPNAKIVDVTVEANGKIVWPGGQLQIPAALQGPILACGDGNFEGDLIMETTTSLLNRFAVIAPGDYFAADAYRVVPGTSLLAYDPETGALISSPYYVYDANGDFELDSSGKPVLSDHATDPFGTLTIDGNLDASAGLTLDSVLDPSSGSSNLLDVSGTATFGGDLLDQFRAFNDSSDSFEAGDAFTILTAGTITGGFRIPVFNSYGQSGPTSYVWGSAIPAAIASADLPALASGLVWTLNKVHDAETNTDALVLAVANPTPQIVSVTATGSPFNVSQYYIIKYTALPTSGAVAAAGIQPFVLQAEGRVDLQDGNGLNLPAANATVGNWSTLSNNVRFSSTPDADDYFYCTVGLQFDSTYNLRIVANAAEKQYISPAYNYAALLPANTVAGSVIGLTVTFNSGSNTPQLTCSSGYTIVANGWCSSWARSDGNIFGDQWFNFGGNIGSDALLPTYYNAYNEPTEFIVQWQTTDGSTKGYATLTNTGTASAFSTAVNDSRYTITNIEESAVGGSPVFTHYSAQPTMPDPGFYNDNGVLTQQAFSGSTTTLCSPITYDIHNVVAPDSVYAFPIPDASGTGVAGVNLTWDDQSTSETGFVVRRAIFQSNADMNSPSNVTWTTLGTVTGTSYQDMTSWSNLSGYAVEYRVEAVNARGTLSIASVSNAVNWRHFIYMPQSSSVTVREANGTLTLADGANTTRYNAGDVNALTINCAGNNETIVYDQSSGRIDVNKLNLTGTGSLTLQVDGYMTLNADQGAQTPNLTLEVHGGGSLYLEGPQNLAGLAAYDNSSIYIQTDVNVGSVLGDGAMTVSSSCTLTVLGDATGMGTLTMGTLTNHGVLAFAAPGTVTVSAPISGNYGVLSLNGGTVELQVDESLQPIFGDGTFNVDAGATVVFGTLTIADGQALGFCVAGSVRMDNLQILDGGSLTIDTESQDPSANRTVALSNVLVDGDSSLTIRNSNAGNSIASLQVIATALTITNDSAVVVADGTQFSVASSGYNWNLNLGTGDVVIGATDGYSGDQSSLTVQGNALATFDYVLLYDDSTLTVDSSMVYVVGNTQLNGDSTTVQLISGNTAAGPAGFWGGDILTLGGTTATLAGDGSIGAGTITAAAGANVNLMPGIVAATMSAAPDPVGTAAGIPAWDILAFTGGGWGNYCPAGFNGSVALIDFSQAQEVTVYTEAFPAYPNATSSSDGQVTSIVFVDMSCEFNDNTINNVIVENAGDTVLSGQTFAHNLMLPVIAFSYVLDPSLPSGSTTVLGNGQSNGLQTLDSYWLLNGGNTWYTSSDMPFFGYALAIFS